MGGGPKGWDVGIRFDGSVPEYLKSEGVLHFIQ